MKASGALLKHIKNKTQQNDAESKAQNLLADDANSPDTSISEAEPVWLILTTKKFMTDHQRLKPRKVTLPHTLNASSNTSICLITPDPQRQFKDAVAHPSFPSSLSQRIAKIISVDKLEKKYHSFESKRQLRDSYDLFLADDRIISYLAKILGKTFYKTTQKRPIPVHLEASKAKPKKNAALPSTKLRKGALETKSVLSPPLFAKEIEKTLSTTQIHLSPSVTTAVKVGLASFTPEQVAANVDCVINGMTDKLIAWRNVRSILLKGANTMALPVWLADELWVDEGMILEDKEVEEVKRIEAQKGKKKRKAIGAPVEEVTGAEVMIGEGTDEKGRENEVKVKKVKRIADDDMSREMRERREKLRQQKKEARGEIESGDATGSKSKATSLTKKRPKHDVEVA